MTYHFDKTFENVPVGLNYIPQLTNYSNDIDGPMDNTICENQSQFIDYEMSACNRYILKEKILLAPTLNSIVEIGVHRADQNFNKTSTSIFLEYKRPNTTYIGIDVDDKSFLNDPSQNIHTIRESSSNFDAIVERLKLLKVEQIDFLFIDGWHSMNQILADWKYVQFLSPGGTVGLHDTNKHPGPSVLCDAIDRNIFSVEKHCIENDHGIAFATRMV